MKKILDLSLYLILDPIRCHDITGMLATTRLAIDNGVTLVQLRAGHEWKKRQCYEAAAAIKQLLLTYSIPLIINDHVDIALAVDADGLHIGQCDLPPKIARRLLGKHKWLGLSVSNQQQLMDVPLNIIDYVGIGPIFPTHSKADADPACGLIMLRQLVTLKQCPAVAIGGINSTNAVDVISTGVDGIAVISAICGTPDPAKATRQLSQQIHLGRQYLDQSHLSNKEKGR